MHCKSGRQIILKSEVMHDKQRTVARITDSLVSLGKSKRLAAMRKSQQVELEKTLQSAKPFSGKKAQQISQARENIEQKIAEIKSALPAGKQSKLFALRYGSEQKIIQLSVQQLYVLLKIKQELAIEIRDVKYRKE
ncbi:hypothetical protein BJAS_P0189 [Bathymodiolus japonicus methanotrophic gill symbiont]|nr:hypothetical protein BJAS_P0189 [Bathymodiolus japonicus methanotrophic gill symbiont]